MKPTDVTTLEKVGHRKVCAVSREAVTPDAKALFSVAMGDKKQWTSEEWNAVLAGLDRCRDTVNDWLALRV